MTPKHTAHRVWVRLTDGRVVDVRVRGAVRRERTLRALRELIEAAAVAKQGETA